MLPPQRRLRKAKDFQKVYLSGKIVSGRFFVLRYCRSNNVNARIGFAVGKKTGNAVVRNRLKRRIREICRKYLCFFEKEYDIVINVRRQAVSASYGDLEKDFLKIIKIAGLYNEKKR